MIELYEGGSSKTADVTFSVGNKTYQAHKSVLYLRCKKLYEIAEDSGDDLTPIPILSTREAIFRKLLEFIYMVRTPIIRSSEIAVELLVAADLYECVPLKLYAESFLVDKCLTTETAASFLVLADSRSCPLLKEAAINLFLDKTEAVQKSKDWHQIEESERLSKELLAVPMSVTKSCVVDKNDGSPPIDQAAEQLDFAEQLDVTSLREELEEFGYPLDGTRELLVERYKQNIRSYWGIMDFE